MKYGTYLLVLVHMTAFKLQSVSIDLFFNVFIFRQKSLFTDVCGAKIVAEKFLNAELMLQTKNHRTPAD